jgi:hypothetical protein
VAWAGAVGCTAAVDGSTAQVDIRGSENNNEGRPRGVPQDVLIHTAVSPREAVAHNAPASSLSPELCHIVPPDRVTDFLNTYDPAPPTPAQSALWIHLWKTLWESPRDCGCDGCRDLWTNYTIVIWSSVSGLLLVRRLWTEESWLVNHRAGIANERDVLDSYRLDTLDFDALAAATGLDDDAQKRADQVALLFQRERIEASR